MNSKVAKSDIDERKAHYRNILYGIRNLPSIPAIIYEVTKLLENPMTSANELAKIITRDQGLVAKILTVANSPLYGLPRRVSTIEFAIVILGFDHIKNIVVALSMIEAIKSKGDRDWDRKNYWVHSFLTASTAKKIADDIGYTKSGEAFTAGLLHDLGISIIQRYFNDEFKAILAMVAEEKISHMAAEEKTMGISHQEVGQFLLNKWNLPHVLSDAVANHHHPSLSEGNPQLASIIHLADYIVHLYSNKTFAWDEKYLIDAGVIEILRLGDANYLEKFLESYQPFFTNKLESINI